MITPRDLGIGISLTHALLVEELERMIDTSLRETFLRGSREIAVPAKFRPVLGIVLDKYRSHWSVDEEHTAQMEKRWVIKAL